MTLKEKVYYQYQEVLGDRIRLLKQNLDGLFDSAQNETKRTAGDKHETALAMLQIEQENMRRQLQEAQLQQSQLVQINATLHHSKITTGSLVKTNLGYFFISPALGKIILDDIIVMSLSPHSPLGTELMGLELPSTVSLNGRRYIIEEIS